MKLLNAVIFKQQWLHDEGRDAPAGHLVYKQYIDFLTKTGICIIHGKEYFVKWNQETPENDDNLITRTLFQVERLGCKDSWFVDAKAGCKAIYGLFWVVSVGLNCQMKFLISTEVRIWGLGSHINEELGEINKKVKYGLLPGTCIIFGRLRGSFEQATENHSMLISQK